MYTVCDFGLLVAWGLSLVGVGWSLVEWRAGLSLVGVVLLGFFITFYMAVWCVCRALPPFQMGVPSLVSMHWRWFRIPYINKNQLRHQRKCYSVWGISSKHPQEKCSTTLSFSSFVAGHMPHKKLIVQIFGAKSAARPAKPTNEDNRLLLKV